MGHDPVLRRRREGGQAIVMVTLALVAMCGVLVLAVDFGWAYFVKRAAQGAADTAAIAAAEEMRRMKGVSGPYPCLGGGGGCRIDFVCASNVTSDTADNLDNACLYARQNGFEEAGRQRVRIVEGSDSEPPTVPGVPLQYWATVRVTETVPQLFSAMTGNPMAVVSARATAGLYQGKLQGSIILLNRDNDLAAWGAGNPTGINMDVQGTADVWTGGGILMASGCAGGCTGGTHAGNLQGANASVTATSTSIRGSGDVGGNNVAGWTPAFQNGFLEGSEFQDPTKKKPQIPVGGTGLADCGIDGGVIRPTVDGGTSLLGPGRYYARGKDKDGNPIATLEPIKILGNVTFTAGGECLAGASNPSGFSNHVVYGGFVFKEGGGGGKQAGPTMVNFEPGKIVMAGVAPQSNGDANALLDLSVGGSAFELRGPGASSAGNVFVFTDANNPGLTNVPTLLETKTASLTHGISGFKSGQSQQVSFELDGLRDNPATGFLPSELKPYNSVVMWQDRRNSSVLYRDDGTYDCEEPYLNCTKSPEKATADGVRKGSQQLFIAAGASTVIRGTMYQPRGAWATIGGSGGMSAALQLITGALQVQATGQINLSPVTSTMPMSIVGLVE